MKKIVLSLFALFCLFIFTSCSKESENTSQQSSSYDFESEFEKAKLADSVEEEILPDPDISDVAENNSSSDFNDISTSSEDIQTSFSATREQMNALKSAKSYLQYSSFSKLSLYDQLIYEEYPADAAQYAIDNVSADWKKNALQTANDYLEFSSFSDQGLYDQLIHDKFTSEEAQYAIDNLPD